MIDLPEGRGPDVVQVISWNDYGESHYVCPEVGVRGAQPGSEAWTDGMDHRAFAEMTRYFARRWRDGMGVVEAVADGVSRNEGDGHGHGKGKGKAWMWYRPHPAKVDIPTDERGKPEHTDWAVDLINVVLILPECLENENEQGRDDAIEAVVVNADTECIVPLNRGQANMFTCAFAPGSVGLEIRRTPGDRDVDAGEVLWRVDGMDILREDEVVRYNYNFWSGSWDVELGGGDGGGEESG